LKELAGTLVEHSPECKVCEDADADPACEFEDALEELDPRNIESFLIYGFMQDQLQYIGMEGVPGPLPLHSLTVGLELLEVPREDWLEIIHRIRLLHNVWCEIQAEERKRNSSNSKRGRPSTESDPRELMSIPFAKKQEST
jgi:hypothetical protein